MQVLHRLDMDTTGIMLFAKDPRVVSAMHEQFRSRTISKTYAAICLGAPSATVVKQPSCVENIGVTPSREWEVDAPLARHPSIATASWVSSTGKSAQTRMIVRAEDCSTQWQGTKVGEAWCQPDTQCMNGACLLECKPVTGAPSPIATVMLMHRYMCACKDPGNCIELFGAASKNHATRGFVRELVLA